MRIRRLPRSWILMAAALAVAAAALAAPQVRMARQVAGAGGGRLAGDRITLTGTVGQGLVARSFGAKSGYQLRSGFWQPAGAVSDVPGEEIPTRPTLYGNYPNPFNPRTEIRFSAGPEAGRASLKVYDVQGRLVVTLLDEVVQPGVRRVVWSGRDDAGGSAASGLYFYRLAVGGETFTRKMLLLK